VYASCLTYTSRGSFVHFTKCIRNYPPPPVRGDYLIENDSISSKRLNSDEKSEGGAYDSTISHEWAGSGIPSMGDVNLTTVSPSRSIPKGTAVGIKTLRVNTGRSTLATISFPYYELDAEGLYIDDIFVSSDSFLEFDVTAAEHPEACYVFTRFDYRDIAHRIGFRFPKIGGRRGAKSVYIGNGVYQLQLDRAVEWSPPMVPEPATYGAGLMAVCLLVSRLLAQRAQGAGDDPLRGRGGAFGEPARGHFANPVGRVF